MTAAEDRRGSRCAADGIDTFITGEAPHWAAIIAEELGSTFCSLVITPLKLSASKPWRLISRKNSGLIGNSSVCQRDSEITVLPKTCSLL
jgi:hypothetical protein